MLLRNMNAELVNGSRGVVVDLIDVNDVRFAQKSMKWDGNGMK